MKLTRAELNQVTRFSPSFIYHPQARHHIYYINNRTTPFFTKLFSQCSSCKIRSNSKRQDLGHLQVCCEDFCHDITAADINKQVESMIKSEKVENRQTTQGMVVISGICDLHIQ